MKRLAPVLTLLGSYFSFAPSAFAQGNINIEIPKPDNLKIDNLGKLISSLIGAILIIATIAAFVYLLLGGFTWITSGGDKANVEAAQKRIQAAIIGLIIVFAAWALMIVIGQFLGIDPFNFVLPSP